MTDKIDCVINASLKVVKCAKSWNNLKAIYFKGEILLGEQGHFFSKEQGYKGRKLMGTILGAWEINVFILWNNETK